MSSSVGFSVVVVTVVVVGGRVVWTKSSSGNDTRVSELLINKDFIVHILKLLTNRSVSLILCNWQSVS